MSAELVDSRVVEMRFDNKDFETNVNQSIKTIDKLKKSLDFENAGESFDSISKAASKCDMKGLENSLDEVSVKFNMLEMVAANVLGNIVNQAISAGTKLVKSLSVDQVTAGWSKYESKTKSVQTIMAATGHNIDFVDSRLEKLIWFADETSYSFTDMVDNIGKFTSAGVDLDTAVDSMMGISNWAAISGAGVQQASRAMYNLSQAMGMGYVGVQDWKSIELANMATLEFKQTVIDTAVEMGLLRDNGYGVITTMSGTAVTAENMRETLKEKWFTGDVLNEALADYNEFANVVYERQKELAEEEGGVYPTVSRTIAVLKEEGYEMDSLGARAFRRAQEAITLTQAIEATSDAVSSGWMRTFELIFGNYDESKRLWTDLSNDLWDIFAGGGEKRNEDLSDLLDSNYQKMLDSMPDSDQMNTRLTEKLADVMSEHMGIDAVSELFSSYDSLEDMLKAGVFDKNDRYLKVAFRELGNDFKVEAETAQSLLDTFQSGDLTLRNAAIKLATSQYGWDEETRRKNVEELGFDYEYLNELADAWRNGEKLDWDQEQKNLEKALAKQVETCSSFADKIKAIDPFGGFFESLTELGGRDKLIGSFQNIFKTFKNVFLTIREVKNGISDFLKELSGGESFLSKIIDGFYRLTSALAFTDEKFEVVQEKIQKFFHGGLQDKWKKFWHGKDVVKGGKVFDALTGKFEQVTEHIPGMAEKIRDFGEIIKDKLGQLDIKFGFTDKLTKALQAITESAPFKAIMRLFGWGDESGETGIDGSKIKGSFKRGFSFSELLFGSQNEGEDDKNISKWTLFKENMKNLFTRGKDGLSKTLTNVKTKFNEILESKGYNSVREFFFGDKKTGKENFIVRTIDHVKEKFEEIKEAHPWIQTAINWIQSQIEKIKEIFKSANGSLTEGLKKVKEYLKGIKDTVTDLFGSIFKKNDKSLFEQITDIISGKNGKVSGKPLFKMVDILKLFIASLSGLNIALLGFNFKVGKFGIQSPLANLVDIIKDFAISVALIAAAFVGISWAMKKLDMGAGDIAKAAGIIVGIMAALVICAKALDMGEKESSLKDIIAQSVTTVPMLKTLAMVLAEIAAIAVVFTLLAKWVGVEYVMAGVFAMSVLLLAIGAAVALLYLPDLKGKNKIKSKAGDLFGIAAILLMLAPMLLALGVVIAEFALIAKWLSKDQESLRVFENLLGFLGVFVGGMLVLLGLTAVFGKGGISKSIVFSLAIIAAIILEIGIVVGALAVMSKKLGQGTMWSAVGMVFASLLGVFLIVLGLCKMMENGVNVTTLVSLGLMIGLIYIIGETIGNLAKVIKDCGSENTWSAFGAILLSFIAVFAALNIMSNIDLTPGQMFSVIKWMAMLGLVALAVLGLMEINKRANITSWDTLVPMLIAIGEVAASMVILSVIISILGGIGGAVAAAFPKAVVAILAVAAGVILIGAAFVGINEAFEWLAEKTGGGSITDSVNNIIEFLVTIMHGIGEMAGALISGIGEGISSSLPDIGTNISDFATNLQSFFDFITTLNESHALGAAIFTGVLLSIAADTFIGGIAALIEKITPSTTEMATNMSDMTDSLSRFFENTKALTQENLDGAGRFTGIMLTIVGDNALAWLSTLIDGFTSESIDMATNMSDFTDSLSRFFTNTGSLTENNVNGAKFLTAIMAEMVKEELIGGLKKLLEFFTGTVDFESFGTSITTIAQAVVDMDTTLEGIDQTKAEADLKIIKAILDFLTDDSYKTGGVSGAIDFIINGSADFKELFEKLNSDVIGGFKTFCTNTAYLNIDNAKKAAEILPIILDMLTDTSYRTGGITGWLTDILKGDADFEGMFDTLNNKILPGLRDFANGINAFTEEGTQIDYSGVAEAVEAAKAIIGLMSMDTGNLINDKEHTFLGIKLDKSDAEKLQDSFEVINTVVVQAIKNLQDALTENEVDADYIGKTVGTYNDLIECLKTFSGLGITPETVSNIGGYIITGLVDALNDGAEDVKTAAQNVANAIVEGLTITLVVNSPSKVTHQIGEYVYQGLVGGIKEGNTQVFNAARDTAQAAEDGLASGVMDTFSNVISAISDGIESDFSDGPVIRPVIDMSDVYSASNGIDAALSRDRAFAISASERGNFLQNGMDPSLNRPSQTFIQNNYSPKALSNIEIYRQTKNQFAMLKGV